MYNIKPLSNRYVVVDGENNQIASYKYKLQAIDHMLSLNKGIEFVPRSIEIYKDLG